MKPTNRYAIVRRVAIPALALPLLFSFAWLQPAPGTDLHEDVAPRSSDALASDALASDALASDALASDGLASDALASAGDLSANGLAEKVIQSSGAIENDVAAFRALLGDPNNGGTPGQQASGRREINWDGVPAAVTNVPNFPPEFFNVNSTRGLEYDAVSPGLEVSDQRFADINPTYAAEFTPFSGQKLFSPIGSNVSEVSFRVAGSAVKAPVRGFGVVFSDVDVAGSTGILVFDMFGRKLGRILAPVRTDARGASFVGVVFRTPIIGRVVLVSGNGALSPVEKDVSQGGRLDLVVMDDFIYGEPSATE